jgi:hypothetical protein
MDPSEPVHQICQETAVLRMAAMRLQSKTMELRSTLRQSLEDHRNLLMDLDEIASGMSTLAASARR